jgi:eukaryotic-like serine/threonine-protein kinase
VIKLGMDTKAVVARFEAERQALAIMDHPNIAKVHDAGATENGRPFFVMELVRGIPITKYCDENHLAPKARLELLIKVCQAVHHAHQKGIIHRDLKPSNILVTVNDGAPTPKVIDFGIAKATQGRLTDATVFTAFEQFIGTPVYMSPEQAEMSSLDIDTRSDIYSLGVLLYELLTGKPPFDPKALVQAGVDQIRQHIREVEPPSPSRRLHTLAADERTTIARLRDTAPAQLSLLLRGDLDWIVMRCLEKDRTRRYDTANGLAMDIQRHLRNEPVVARPPSTAYLLQKLFRRHRLGFAATVAIVVSLISGAVVSTWQAARAREAEAKAETAREAETRLRHEAQSHEIVSRQRAYAADMNLVPQALAVADVARAYELLDRHKPLPGQSDLRGWEWRYLWQFCQPEWESVLCENAGTIRSLSVSGDGHWLAVAGRRLSIRNLITGKELTTPFNGTSFARVALANGRPLLAAYTSDSEGTSPDPSHRIILWNFQTGEVAQELRLAGECGGLSFSEDSTILAAGIATPEDKIVLWSVADGRVLRSVIAPQRGGGLATPHTPFATTRNLDLAAHVTDSGELRVVDLNNGVARWVKVGADEGSIVGAIAFSPDGRFIASSAYFGDMALRVWDAASGKLIQRLEGHRGPVFSLMFWPGGEKLASASNDRTIRIWDVPSAKQIDVLQGHKSAVSHLALLSDNTTLVSGASDGAVCLWNVESRRPKEALIRLPDPVGAWRFAVDGTSVLTAIGDGDIVRWHGVGLREKTVELQGKDVGKIIADWRMGPEQFSPDLRYVAFRRIDADGKIEVWDTITHRLCQKFEAPFDIYPVAHFSDRHSVRVFARDPHGPNSIRCLEWDLQSSKETRSWTIPIGRPPPPVNNTPAAHLRSGLSPSSFLTAAFSADGERCLISSARKFVVYNLRTGASQSVDTELAQRFPQFSPDGQHLAGREVSEIKLWETATFRKVATLPTTMRMPQSVAFSTQGDRLAVGSSGVEAIMLWNFRTHDPVITLEATDSQFVRTAFSPDGNRLGSRSTHLPGSDGFLHIWCAPSWEEIEAAEGQRTPSSRSVSSAP